MITEQDLLEAIAACQGERNPTSSTCIKLAAFYTIKNELFGNPDKFAQPSYSFAAPPGSSVVSYTSKTEFGKLINGRNVDDILSIMDDLMSVIWMKYPKLYASVINELEQ